MMKNLDVFGPFTGPTGYDQVVRGFVSRLSRSGVKISLRNYAEWSMFNFFHSDELKAMENPLGSAPVRINFCLPPQAEYVPHQFNVIYSMFEASAVN